MTTTPERKTPEQIARKALVVTQREGLPRPRQAAQVISDLRAHGLLVDAPAEGWSTADRRAAETQAKLRWPINKAHTWETERDQIIFQQGCINGFILGAEWQSSVAAGVAPQEPESGRCGGCWDLGPHRNVPGCEHYKPEAAPPEPSEPCSSADEHYLMESCPCGYERRPAPSPDREVLIAEARRRVEDISAFGAGGKVVMDALVARNVTNLIGRMADALDAAPVVDEAKLAEAIADELETDDRIAEEWSSAKLAATARRLVKFAVKPALRGER